MIEAEHIFDLILTVNQGACANFEHKKCDVIKVSITNSLYKTHKMTGFIGDSYPIKKHIADLIYLDEDNIIYLNIRHKIDYVEEDVIFDISHIDLYFSNILEYKKWKRTYLIKSL